MIKTELTSIEKLEQMGIRVILDLHNNYRVGNLDYIRDYCNDNGLSETQVFMYLCNNVNDSILYDKNLLEIEGIDKDLSFTERYHIALKFCELKY